MTYVSHTVRSLRDDPIPGETVRLVVTLADDADPAAVREDLAASDCEVVRELDFGSLLVVADHERLDAVCALDGLTAVETDAVLGPT